MTWQLGPGGGTLDWDSFFHQTSCLGLTGDVPGEQTEQRTRRAGGSGDRTRLHREMQHLGGGLAEWTAFPTYNTCCMMVSYVRQLDICLNIILGVSGRVFMDEINL